MSRESFRRAFQKRSFLFVRVRPQGLEVEDQLLDTLTGRIQKTQLIRKLFEDGTLACDSLDGVTARDGTLCDTCRHPQCQPRLRIQLAAKGGLVFLIDLPHTSATNFLSFADQVPDIDTIDVTLSVEPHLHWGEVCFHRANRA